MIIALWQVHKCIKIKSSNDLSQSTSQSDFTVEPPYVVGNLKINMWHYCNVLFGYSSQYNGLGNFTVESPNDGHMRVIIRQIKDIILVHHSDCDTCDDLWCQDDDALTDCAVGTIPDCYIFRLYHFFIAYN